MSAALAREARQFLLSTRHAILSTFSVKYPDYPFGSVAPFVCNHGAEPILLISTLAEHTHNILANPKVSLLVFSGAEDLQANARLTLMGEAVACDKQDSALRARYLRYLPQAASYFDMHDFSFYRIQISQARYIAGFGRMGWFTGNALDQGLDAHVLAEQESDIVSHMNADHQHNLLQYCQHVHGVHADRAEMIGIDSEGFDVRYHQGEHTEGVLRFQFDQPVTDAQSARVALVALAKACKA